MRDAYGIHDAEFFGTENGMRRKQQFTESIEGKAMRGNILIADFLCVEAHRAMNVNLIECISKNWEVDVLSVNGYYSVEQDRWRKSGIRVINTSVPAKKNGAAQSRFFSLKIMRSAGYQLKKKNYSMVIVLGFDTLAYGMAKSFAKKTPVAVFHHKNIDELSSTLKKIVFDCYKNKIHHLVFEQFFADHLINDIGVDVLKVHVVPHPVLGNFKPQEGKFKYDCVGLCNSNSEMFIEKALNEQKKFEDNDLKILLRSKNKKVHTHNVDIISGYLEEYIYVDYINSARTVLIPVPDTYVYRLSGSIYDALSRRKHVFTTSQYYANDYGRRYPGICDYIKDVADLIHKLRNTDFSEEDNTRFDRFIAEHSVENVSAKLDMTIKKIIGVNL
jgi:hypothetical protein